MRKKLSIVSCVGLLICFVICPAAHSLHWTPPGSTIFWETVWGYVSGFDTLDPGDEVAAFRVDNDAIAGLTTVVFDGSNFLYNMVVFAPDITPFDVYFLVWDGAAELGATSNFTTNPEEFGAGPTQHNLGQAVPEPPTIAIMGLSLIFIWVFIVRPQFATERWR